jgi:hypothetical protein
MAVQALQVMSLITRERAGALLLGLWAVVAGLLLALLALQHSAPEPEPQDRTLLAHAMLMLRRHSDQSFLVHVIYSDCSCSRGLLTHLLSRHAFSGTEELILFVGADSREGDPAIKSGFEFVHVSADYLASHFGLQAAPVLIVFNKKGQLQYAGGYYDSSATVAPRDERVYAQLTAGSQVTPMPVFGCAVSVDHASTTGILRNALN